MLVAEYSKNRARERSRGARGFILFRRRDTEGLTVSSVSRGRNGCFRAETFRDTEEAAPTSVSRGGGRRKEGREGRDSAAGWRRERDGRENRILERADRTRTEKTGRARTKKKDRRQTERTGRERRRWTPADGRRRRSAGEQTKTGRGRTKKRAVRRPPLLGGRGKPGMT